MASLKLVIFSLLLAFAYSSSDTPHCDKDAVSFGKCLGSEYTSHKDDYNTKLDKAWERIGQCFKDNDCKEPSPNDKALQGFKGLKIAWDGLPKDAKACIAQAAAKKHLKITNACLKEHKVDELPEPEVEENDLEEFSNDSLPHHRLFKGLQQVVVALKRCRQDKGQKAANATLGCMVTVKQDIKEEVCNLVHKCRQDKVSDTCHQKGQKVHQALCECGKDKLKSIIKTFDDLESKGKDVTAEELVHDFCTHCKDDAKEIAEGMKKCFKEKDVKLPAPDQLAEGVSQFVTVLVNDPTGPAHAVFVAISHEDKENNKFTKKDLGEVRQLLNDILRNFDCGCTEVS
jgi:hypothetical protein